MLTILFDGVAYGMVLFVLAVGLSVTLGLMNFINLAHGAFAMAGGYLAVPPGQPRRRAVPCRPAAGLPRNRDHRRRHRADALSSMSTPRAISIRCSSPSASSSWRSRPSTISWARSQQFIELPEALQPTLPGSRRRDRRLSRSSSSSSAAALALGAGASPVADALRQPAPCRRRQCAPSPAASASRSAGVFALTFAVGSGLAGIGGALGAEFLGLDPTFPLKFLVYFLIVVAVGGTSTLVGPLIAALILGVADVAGKYYVPAAGGFIIYSVMVAILLWRPHGLLGEAR